MLKYRDHLPQLDGGMFLTDGGIETTLIFHDGLELPYFAAFHLLKNEAGSEALLKYYRSHASIARANGVGFILESPTWRSSADWGAKLGYSDATIAGANRSAIERMESCVRSSRHRSRLWSSAAAWGRAATAMTRAR